MCSSPVCDQGGPPASHCDGKFRKQKLDTEEDEEVKEPKKRAKHNGRKHAPNLRPPPGHPHRVTGFRAVALRQMGRRRMCRKK